MHMQILNGGLGGVGFNPPPLSVYSKVSLNPAPIDRPSLSLPLGGIRDVGVPPVEGCREGHAGVRPRTLLDPRPEGGVRHTHRANVGTLRFLPLCFLPNGKCQPHLHQSTLPGEGGLQPPAAKTLPVAVGTNQG